MKIYDWKKFTTFIALLLLFILVCLQQCSKKELKLDHIEEYEVRSGETLWSISNKFRTSGMSIEEYIYNIRKLNDEQDCIIYPNQVLQIPIYEEVWEWYQLLILQ